MKNLKVLLAIIVLGLASPALLEADDNSGGRVPSETIVLHPKEPAGRPNAPARSRIECYHYDGVLEFSFPDNVMVMLVELNNGEHNIAESISYESPVLELPPLSGEFEIRCTTDDGRTFYGMILLAK